MADLAILRVWGICASLESESEEESSEYMVRETACLAGSSSEDIDVRGERGGSGTGDCLWILARCRVTRGSGTVGSLREEDSLTSYVVGGKPSGLRMIMVVKPDIRSSSMLKKKVEPCQGNGKEH